MAHTEVLSTRYPESVDQVLRMTWKAPDANGVLVPIPLADVTALLYSLFVHDASNTIINGRDNVNVLNAGPGTYHATSGLLTITLSAADQAIVGADAPSAEVHKARVKMTYGGGKTAVQIVQFTVDNLPRVP